MFSLAPTVFYKLLNSLPAGKNQEILHQNPDFFTSSTIGEQDHVECMYTRQPEIQLTGAERQHGAALGLAQATSSPGPHPLYHTSYVPSLTSLMALMGSRTSEGQGIVWIPTDQVQETELGLERNQVSQLSVLYSSLAPHTVLSHFQMRLLWV